MKKENIYWVVARSPYHDYGRVFISHYKPHYLNSCNEWKVNKGERFIVPIEMFGEKFVGDDFLTPRKVKISIEVK